MLAPTGGVEFVATGSAPHAPLRALWTGHMYASLPPDNSAPAFARSLVRDAVDESIDAPIRQDIELIAAELVANAVIHGKPPFELTLVVRGGTARVEVRDHSPQMPRATEPGEDGGGYGLVLVEALSASWGATPMPPGKVVWAEFQTSPLDHRLSSPVLPGTVLRSNGGIHPGGPTYAGSTEARPA
jgi:anti-sigma regulatory factor (Ser/Thr protein kinase)